MSGTTMETNADKALANLLNPRIRRQAKRKRLFPFVCTVCATFNEARALPRVKSGVDKSELGNAPSFKVVGCGTCGHMMTRVSGQVRDLTMAQADELAARPDFDRIRLRIEDAVYDKIG